MTECKGCGRPKDKCCAYPDCEILDLSAEVKRLRRVLRVIADITYDQDVIDTARAALTQQPSAEESCESEAERLRTLLQRVYTDLCVAYRHWDADRDSKVGKIIGDACREIRAALAQRDAGGEERP